MPDLSWREGLVMAPLLGLIVFLGVYPQADARPHRAVGRPPGRPHRGQLRLRASPRSPRSAPVKPPRASTATRRASRRGGGGAVSLLAILSQPVDAGPPCRSTASTSPGRPLRPDARPRRRRACCCSSPTRCPPASRCTGVYALVHRRSSPPVAIGVAVPAVAPRAGPGPRAVLHARPGRRRRRLLRVRHRRDLRRGDPRRAARRRLPAARGHGGRRALRPACCCRRRAA